MIAVLDGRDDAVAGARRESELSEVRSETHDPLGWRGGESPLTATASATSVEEFHPRVSAAVRAAATNRMRDPDRSAPGAMSLCPRLAAGESDGYARHSARIADC